MQAARRAPAASKQLSGTTAPPVGYMHKALAPLLSCTNIISNQACLDACALQQDAVHANDAVHESDGSATG